MREPPLLLLEGLNWRKSELDDDKSRARFPGIVELGVNSALTGIQAGHDLRKVEMK